MRKDKPDKKIRNRQIYYIPVCNDLDSVRENFNDPVFKAILTHFFLSQRRPFDSRRNLHSKKKMQTFLWTIRVKYQ